MGIINKDLSHTQQRQNVNVPLFNVPTGATIICAAIPCASSLDYVQVMANGLSGAPVYTLFLERFIVGTGYTTVAIGTSFTPPEYGTSGVFSVTFGVSLPQIGSTLTTLQASDLIVLVSSGSNTAVKSLSVNLGIRPLLDIAKFYGIL